MKKFFEIKNNCSQKLLMKKLKKIKNIFFLPCKNFNTEKTQSRLSK